MSPVVLQRELQQTKPFSSLEQAVLIGLRLAAHRVWDPWTRFLEEHADLTPNQYNVLRILRGAGVAGCASGSIGERMITRDPDVTRLVDRLAQRGLVRRVRDEDDRRVVRVLITPAGLELLNGLDDLVREMPVKLLGEIPRAKLEQLSKLLDDVIEHVGQFP